MSVEKPESITTMYAPIQMALDGLREAVRELHLDFRRDGERNMLIVKELQDLKKVQMDQTAQLISALQNRIPEGSIDLESHRSLVKTLLWAAVFLVVSIAGISKIPDPHIRLPNTMSP